ncbi:hypothetical protein [Paenibacillus sp. CH40]|uniref:hypothetical protein n=1 Tax=Paenibacillus sp. CH40 TaxID=2962045 RepID=UPI0020B6F617|nr:hypothetical protein [Paenibacillus sp. CH40]MCP3794000.1 hypothetical protein [Paenibacillus sp. CH40]
MGYCTTGLRDVAVTLKYTADPSARIAPFLPLPFSDCADLTASYGQRRVSQPG